MKWMRRRLIARATSLALALLMTLAGLRSASAAGCVDDDCDRPCCARDTEQRTVLPILPCCRLSVDQASGRSAPTTVDQERAHFITPAVAAVASLPGKISSATGRPRARHLPAPPLYHRHCALLL